MSSDPWQIELIEAFQKDPVLFAQVVLGVTPWSKQEEIMFSVRDNKYTCVQSGHNVGKTFITACICLWFVSCFPNSVILTTANGWGQVKGVLWEEIRKLHRKAVWPIGGQFKPKHPDLRLGDNWMFGFSPDKTDSINGHHRDNILIVFDEAQGLQDRGVWEAFSSMMTSAGARQLAIGNPLYSVGPFREKFRDKHWNSIKISCLEHPNYVERMLIVPGALTYESICEIEEDPLRGPGTNYWDTRIAGEFPPMSGDTFLPEIFLDNVINVPEGRTLLPGRYIGLDPAAMGDDRTVACVMVNGRVVEMQEWRRAHPAETVNRTLKLAAHYNIPLHHINYDCIGGVGGAIRQAFDIARVPAHPVHVGSTNCAEDWQYLFSRDANLIFWNRRAELHWAFRRCCEDQLISIPPRYRDMFMRESCLLRYGIGDTGKLFIESKPNKFKPREGYSPDYNDAMCLALARDQKLLDLSLGGANIEDGHAKYDQTGLLGSWDLDA